MTPDEYYALATKRNLGIVSPEEQQQLRRTRIAIIGMGGGGGIYLTTFARMGIGHFNIADFDAFSVVNVNRQAGAMQSTIGKPKVEVMAGIARDIHPGVDITCFDHGIGEHNVEAFIANADIVISAAYFFRDDASQRSIAGWCLVHEYLPISSVFHRGNCANHLFQITAGAPWGKLYRLDFLNRNAIRFPALPRAEDFMFVYWALALAGRITSLSDGTILYRMGNRQTSLEGAKDNFPLAPVEGSLLLYDKLNELGVYEQMRQSFLNNTVTRILYNIGGYQTCAAMDAMYQKTREVLFPLYGNDLLNPSFFYDKRKHAALLDIYESANSLEFVFKRYRKTLDAYEALKSREDRIQSGLTPVVLPLPRKFSGPWVVRKFKGGVQCYKDHGLQYTLKHLIKKVLKRLKRKA